MALFWYFPLWFHDTLIWLLNDMETGHILQVKLLGKQGEVCFHRCVKSHLLGKFETWVGTKIEPLPAHRPHNSILLSLAKGEACLYRHFHI